MEFSWDDKSSPALHSFRGVMAQQQQQQQQQQYKTTKGSKSSDIIYKSYLYHYQQIKDFQQKFQKKTSEIDSLQNNYQSGNMQQQPAFLSQQKIHELEQNKNNSNQCMIDKTFSMGKARDHNNYLLNNPIPLKSLPEIRERRGQKQYAPKFSSKHQSMQTPSSPN
eukprot:TRINITY_DN17107_c2_g1_i1.p2 TRINITY_DN17107_c2_g1~~TRINITY_DN17107_c2_g1_i1.p2  ORF type:complete len:165 (-),score=6.86 TRINITY_DN17107_c2_g1_i1:33-527(-)